MSNKIQIKRGLKANLPVLNEGEPAFTTDTKEFFVGDGTNNIEFAKQEDLELINNQVSDLNFQTAGGTGTAITLKINQIITNGLAVTFIASANNGGAATTINGKPLYKPNTKTVPNLIAGKAYTVWYNSTSDCFFIKASAEGNTIAAHVLAVDTFSNDSDTGLIGTMPNNGALNSSLNCGESFNIPAGYTTGGTIIANSLASQTQTPNYSADASKILDGYYAWVNGNLIRGNATIQSLGGTVMNYTSGKSKLNGKYPGGLSIDISNNVWFDPKIITGHMSLYTNGYTSTYGFTVVRNIADGNMLSCWDGQRYRAYQQVCNLNAIPVATSGSLSDFVYWQAWGWE